MAAMQGVSFTKYVDANDLSVITNVAADMMERIQSHRRFAWAYNNIDTTGPGNCLAGGMTTNYSAERSVVNPTLVAGTIFFPTFAPTNAFCASDGASYLYALFYKTGTAATAPVIGTTESGGYTKPMPKRR
jgi:Tfp pilus tip-associated adhesin PilY1